MTDPVLDSDADLAALLATARREALEEAAREVEAMPCHSTSSHVDHAMNLVRTEAVAAIRLLASASPAPREPAPKHPCACGHAHLAGSDGEDGGCRDGDCTCGRWRAPPAPSQQTGGGQPWGTQDGPCPRCGHKERHYWSVPEAVCDGCGGACVPSPASPPRDGGT